MPPSSSQRRAALAFIFVTVTIDLLSFGIIIPVLPHLIQDFVGGDVAKAATWSGIFSTVFGATQFICSPIQGALSDRFGRRPVILLSCLGLGLDFLLMSHVNTLALLLVGRVISGMTAASFSTANAYIADVTPPAERGRAFGLLGASFGIGFVAGPAIGSALSTFGVRAPFVGAAILALCNFLYGMFVLPESLPVERRSAKFDWASATAFGSFKNLRRYPHVLGLAAVTFLANMAHYSLPATFVLYADYRYHWDAKRVGYVLAAVGACGGLVQALVAGKVIARIGERKTLIVGCCFGVVGFAIYGLAPTGLAFILGIPIMSLWGLSSPAVQALMSQKVDPSEQGRLQGAVSGLMSLAGIFAPSVFASLFAMALSTHTRFHVPGAAFLLASALVGASTLVAIRATRTAAE